MAGLHVVFANYLHAVLELYVYLHAYCLVYLHAVLAVRVDEAHLGAGLDPADEHALILAQRRHLHARHRPVGTHVQARHTVSIFMMTVECRSNI